MIEWGSKSPETTTQVVANDATSSDLVIRGRFLNQASGELVSISFEGRTENFEVVWH